MKIGKGPRRFGGPSESFQKRKADDMQRQAKELRLSARTVPAEGPLMVFLDDLRPAPAGWVLVTDAAALASLIDAEGSRIVRLSLDWDLGSGVPNGHEAARDLADRFGRDPSTLPEIETINFHSDKHEAALEMYRLVRGALPEDRKYDICMDVGKPNTGPGRRW